MIKHQHEADTNRLFLAFDKFNPLSSTQLRVRLRIPSHYRQQPILSRLISNYKLIVNITGAQLERNTQEDGNFELELRGTPHQIRQGLAFLESMKVQITGKPGTSGDGWHY